MANIVLFGTPNAALPSYITSDRAALKARASELNADVITGPTYPVLSIKGKVFTLIKGNDKKVLTRADDPEAALQFVNLSVVRANVKSRVFFAKAYVEGSEGVEARPDCYSVDGIVPAADAQDRQAPKCAICPHAVWGSRANMEGKGTACSVNTRAAVLDPDTVQPGEKLEPYLLRIPAGSRTNFSDVVKAAEQRNIPYNALVLKVGFDNEAPAPKLTFKLVGLLSDSVYAAVEAAYSDQTVEDMLGYRPQALEAPPTEADADVARLLAEKQTREAAETAAAAEAAAAAERARQASVAPPPPQPAARTAVDVSGLDAMMGGQATTPPAAAPATALAPADAPATPQAPVAPTAPPRRRRSQAEMAAARAAEAAALQAAAPQPPAAAAVAPAQPAVAPAAAAQPVVAAATNPVVAPAAAAASDHADLLGNLDALLDATDD
jgi:hypothetical protein